MIRYVAKGFDVFEERLEGDAWIATRMATARTRTNAVLIAEALTAYRPPAGEL